MNQITFTLYRQAGDGVLGKSLALKPDGTLDKSASNSILWLGKAQTLRIEKLSYLSDWFNNVQLPNTALGLGTLIEGGEATIASADIIRRGEVDGAIPKNLKTFHFKPDQAGLMLIDGDMKGIPPELAARIESVPYLDRYPLLKGHGTIFRKSTSSGLYRTDTREWFPSRDGYHVYFAVKDASDIPRATKVLHKRAWLDGFGWHMVGAKGALLERSLVDDSIGSPERLVFEAPAICLPPVAQDPTVRRAEYVDGPIMDTRAVLVDLTPEEEAEYARLVEASKQATKPQADAVRASVVSEEAKATGRSVAAVQADYDMADRGTLPPDFVLYFDKPELGAVTVNQALSRPDEFNQQTLGDPLDPEDGKGKAKLFVDGLRPMINSFAHGGRKYMLTPTPQMISDVMGDIPDAPQTNAPNKNHYVEMIGLVADHVGPDKLPMTRYTEKGNVAHQQTASPANIAYLMQVAGLTKLFNLQSQTVEWKFEEGPLVDFVAQNSDHVSAVPIMKEIAAWCWIPPSQAQTALEDISHREYHPMENWLDNLPPWDGVDRLTAMADALPSPNPIPYRRAVISKWFIQGVQAIKGWRGEAQQIPHVLVWAGKQGAGKTRWVKTCAPPEFTRDGATLGLTGDPAKDRDSIRAATNKPIVELGELEASFGKSGIEAMKNFLSLTSNTYRLSYAKLEITVPRCTIFAGTVNTMGFLHDETGSRRFWPIELTGDLLPVENVDQVWAQAFHLWKSGAIWFLSDDEKRMHSEVADQHSEGSTVEDVMSLRFPYGFWTRPSGMSASDTDPMYDLLSLSEIAEKCDLGSDARTRRQIRAYVEKNGGRLGRYKNHTTHLDRTTRRNKVVMALKGETVTPFVAVQPYNTRPN